MAGSLSWLKGASQRLKCSAGIGPLQPPSLSGVSGLLATVCDTKEAQAKVSAQMRARLKESGSAAHRDSGDPGILLSSWALP